MKIGDVARATGISVRTLHYYEELGLVRPARRTAQGHRLYGDRELARLQQVLSLRALGLSLVEIRDVLAQRSAPPLAVIERHLDRVREEIRDRTRLLSRLETLAARMRRGERPTPEQLLRAMQESVMIDKPTIEKYFTTQEIERLVARRAGTDVRGEANDWRAVIAELRSARDRGLAPDDPSLAPTAKRWISLLRALGADDPGVDAALAKLYRGESHLSVQYGLDGGLDAYVGQMLRANGWPTRA